MANNVFNYPEYGEVVGFESLRSQVEDAVQEVIDANNAVDKSQSESIASNTELINDEVERSKSADVEFENDLAKEIDDRKRMGGILNGKISDEAKYREDGDAKLGEDLKSFKEDANSKFEDILGKISEEVSNREGADDSIKSTLEGETLDRISEDNKIKDLISDEAKYREDGDDKLGKKIGELKSEVDNLETELGKEKEIREKEDTNIKETLKNEVSNLTNYINDEKKDRIIGDTELRNSLKSYKVVEVEGSNENVRKAFKLAEKIGGGEFEVIGDAIEIYKDSSLKEVKLEGQILNFTYILADGTESTVGVDVSNFLVEEEFANGLQVNESVVSIKIDAASETFLSVSSEGIKLSGVRSAIETAKEDIIKELNKETNDRQSADTVLNTRIDTLDDRIDGLNSKIDTEKQVLVFGIDTNKGSIRALDGRIATEEQNRQKADAALDARVTTNEGSISTLDGKVTANEGLIGALDGRVTANEGLIGTLDGKVTANEGLIGALDGKITTEEQNRKDADENLARLIGVMDERILKLTELVNKLTIESNSNKFVKSISSLKSGDNVELVLETDLVLGDDRITIPEGATLKIDLNGKTIKCGIEDIMFRVNGSLTIDNGKIETSGYIASANEGSRVVVEDGVYNAFVTCFQSNGGYIEINGGEFNGTYEPYGGTYTLNFIDTKIGIGEIVVKGGTFVDYDPSNSKSEPVQPMNFVAEGYKVVSEEVDGVTYYKVVEE